MGLYDRIKRVAKDKHLPISTVEKAAGLANGSIGKWNDVSPSVSNLKKVADALDVPIEELLK